MKELKKEISKKKAEIWKSKKQIKDDKKIIKRISLIFKLKTYETVYNRFNRLYAIKNDLREEIGNFLERLKGYLDSTLNHTINNDIPSTNNLLEGFYKITFPRKIKKIFVTYHGAMNRIALNNIRWMKRNGRYKTLASVWNRTVPNFYLFLDFNLFKAIFVWKGNFYLGNNYCRISLFLGGGD